MISDPGSLGTRRARGSSGWGRTLTCKPEPALAADLACLQPAAIQSAGLLWPAACSFDVHHVLSMHPSLLTGGTGRPKPKKPRLSPVRRASPPRFYFHSRAQVSRPAGSQGLCGSSLYLLSYSLPCSSTGLGGLHRAAVTEPYHRPPRLRAQLLYQSSCLHPFEQQVAEPTYPVETCVSALPHHQNTCSFGRRTATGGLRPGYSQPSSCGR